MIWLYLTASFAFLCVLFIVLESLTQKWGIR